MSTPPVTCEIDGKVAVISLDDGKANALSYEVIDGVRAAFEKADAEASAVMLKGREGRFSAGFDLSVMSAGPEQARDLVTAGCHLLLGILEHPQPVVAACTGHALAAGALMLLSVDTRIGTAGNFKIGLNEVAIGMRLPIFAVELARERLSKRRFTEATQLGNVLDPETAVDVGYLDRVVEPDQLETVAMQTAAALAELPRDAYSQTKNLARGKLIAHVRATLEEDMARVAPPTTSR